MHLVLCHFQLEARSSIDARKRLVENTCESELLLPQRDDVRLLCGNVGESEFRVRPYTRGSYDTRIWLSGSLERGDSGATIVKGSVLLPLWQPFVLLAMTLGLVVFVITSKAPSWVVLFPTPLLVFSSVATVTMTRLGMKRLVEALEARVVQLSGPIAWLLN